MVNQSIKKNACPHLQRAGRGFTLLEVLLVLMVVAIISLLGVGRLGQVRQEKELLIVQKNAQHLMNALDAYYRMHLVQGDFDSKYDANAVNQAALIADGLWPKLLETNLVTPSSTNPDVSAIDVTSPRVTPRVYRLQVRIIINYLPVSAADPNITWYKNYTHASIVTIDNTSKKLMLLWQATSGTVSSDLNSSLWISGGIAKSFKKYAPKPQL